MNFLKPTILKILIAIVFFVFGCYITLGFLLGASFGGDANLFYAFTSIVSIAEMFIALGGMGSAIIITLTGVKEFYPNISGDTWLNFLIIFQAIWSYLLSCLLVFLGKKIFK